MNTQIEPVHTLVQIESEIESIATRVFKDQWRIAKLLAEARDFYFVNDKAGFVSWARKRINDNKRVRWLLVYDRFSDYTQVAAAMSSENPIDFSKLYELQGCDDSQFIKQQVRKLIGPNPPTHRAIREAVKALKEPAPEPAATPDPVEIADRVKTSVVQSMPKNTPKSTVNKIVSGLKKEAQKLANEFDNAVNKRVEQQVEKQKARVAEREAEAKKKMDQAIKIKAGVKAFMTKDEFMLVRKCLHPDINPHPDAAKAFAIFNRLADVKNW